MSENVIEITHDDSTLSTVMINGAEFPISIDMKKAIRLFEVTGHYILTHSTNAGMIMNPHNFYKFLMVMVQPLKTTPEALLDEVKPSEYLDNGAKMYLMITKFVPSNDQIERVNAMLTSNLPKQAGEVPNENPQSSTSTDSGPTEFEDSDLLPNVSGL